MATDITKIATSDKLGHFDRVAARIEGTFRELIDQLISRRDHLLGKVLQLREDFRDKEATRVAALEELEETQLHLEQLSVKVNINLSVHEQAGLVYQQAKEQLSAPTTLPNLSFSCPALSLLQSQLSQFGELVELQVTDYSKKREPILTAGKELDGRGVTLDEQNEKVYIADSNKSQIQVLSFQGEFLSQFGNKILDRPWGIAATERHIYVTDHNLSKLFQFCKTTHELTNTAGGVETNEGQLFYPRGLTIDKSGEVFIADSLNHRVSVFNSQLQFQSCIGKGFLSYPHDVQLTPDKVLVLDGSPECVHFFSRSGDLLSSCVSQGEGQAFLVKEAYFFCLDGEQNLIISDRSNHNVKIVSNSGELLSTIGKEGNGKGEFYRPYGIAVSNSGIIFVLSRNSNYSLQCF